MITYFLTFADNGVEVMCDDFVNIDQARDCAWEYSASSNRRINIYESFGLSQNLIESVLA